MELDQLRYFLRVAELQNFTRAAEALGLSQPALSRSIQKLEESLGVPLLIRKTRRVELSDAGRILEPRARQILSMLEEIRCQIHDDGKSGRVRIGAIPTIAPYFLPAFLKYFSRQYPLAITEVYEDTTKNLLHQCQQGELEFAILALPIHEKYLDSIELFKEELFLALPLGHPLSKKRHICAEDLSNLPFVMLDEPHCLSDNILAFCHNRSIKPVVVGRTNQLSMVQELVSLSHGITMVPKMAQQIDRSRTRVYRSLSGVAPTRTVGVIWDPYRFQSRLTRSALDALRQYCRKNYE
jgi:LysR family hydrogen peroxide-inducible transcriptional activator